MKRLPIYALLVAGYTIILIGVNKLYKGLSHIEVINIPAQEETVVKLDIVPAIIVGIFVLIIMVSVGVYLLTELWKYFWAHKTLLLAIKVMNGVKVMIEQNAQQFVDNLAEYITAFNTLGTYTLIGIGFVALSVIYSVLLKRGIIFA